MDGHRTARARALLIVRSSFLLGLAGLLLVVSGDLRGRLAGAETNGSSNFVPFGYEIRKAEEEARAVWNAREHAISLGDLRVLRHVTEEPLTSTDVAGRRWNRPRERRPLPQFERVLMPSRTARMMVVAFSMDSLTPPQRTGSDWTVLAAYVRSSVNRPWRLALEVPMASWPWKRGLYPQNRTADLPAKATLRPHVLGRSVTQVVQIPLVLDRTLICGAVRAKPRRRLPPEQVCVVVHDAKPNRPHRIGSTQPLPN